MAWIILAFGGFISLPFYVWLCQLVFGKAISGVSLLCTLSAALFIGSGVLFLCSIAFEQILSIKQEKCTSFNTRYFIFYLFPDRIYYG